MPRHPTANPPASPYPVKTRKAVGRRTGKWTVLWQAKWKIAAVAVLASGAVVSVAIVWTTDYSVRYAPVGAVIAIVAGVIAGQGSAQRQRERTVQSRLPNSLSSPAVNS